MLLYQIQITMPLIAELKVVWVRLGSMWLPMEAHLAVQSRDRFADTLARAMLGFKKILAREVIVLAL